MENRKSMGKIRVAAFLVIYVITSFFLCGCGSEKKEEPITLTIWHVYGDQTDSPLNNLIKEFNDTVGQKQGITIQPTKVSDTNTLHEAVLSSAKSEPGSEALPDIFVAYPKTVLAMEQADKLVDFQDYFSENERKAFIPAFLEEGMIDGELKILPVAKSTECLFVNQTLFDRYAKESGAKIEDLSTWEGLFKTARSYKEKTGNTFFVHDYHFNYFQVGVQSLGGQFFSDSGVNYDDTFKKVWNPFAEAAVDGAFWLSHGYATEALRTADAVASVASSASVLYYPDKVTYSDNTSEDIEMVVRPCPVFSDGKKMVMQRGAGMCVVKSDEEREKAAMTFLKWLTEPEKNVEFVTSCGYMPVTEKGFSDYLPKAIESLDNPKYKSLYEAFLQTQEEYEFYTPPQVSFYLDTETQFEKSTRQELTEASLSFEEYEKKANPETSIREKKISHYSEQAYEAFLQVMK